MVNSRLSRGAALFALALLAGACGKKADSKGDANVPDVSAAGDAKVPDVAAAGVPDVASGSDDADTREIARYQLTMADLRKWAVASEKYHAYLRQHPELAKDNDKESKADDSLDEIEARVERLPEVRRLIESAGLGVRQFAVISFALLQASVGHMLVQQGQSPDSVAREFGIHPANLRFVKENEAELAKMKPLLQ